MPKTTVGDLEVAYEVTGSGPPVVMINGIGSPRAGWSLQVPALSRYFTVLTFDNRDVGETGAGADPKPYAMRQFADDVAGLMDAVGWRSAHIVGASMGGAIAQEFAIGYPDRTRSVSIVCSWPKSDPWMIELMTQWDHVFETQGRVAWDRTTFLWVSPSGSSMPIQTRCPGCSRRASGCHFHSRWRAICDSRRRSRRTMCSTVCRSSRHRRM
ncbi:MAG: alpha/beta hydrolase [Thermomicrobiales bacterium]